MINGFLSGPPDGDTMDLAWKKNGGRWHTLSVPNVPLPGSPYGVYIIWSEDNPRSSAGARQETFARGSGESGDYRGRVIYVGQGYIANLLDSHQKDLKIQAYARNGPLLVTWAVVRKPLSDGVERFLADHYCPLVGKARPDVDPIPVNLPS